MQNEQPCYDAAAPPVPEELSWHGSDDEPCYVEPSYALPEPDQPLPGASGPIYCRHVDPATAGASPTASGKNQKWIIEM